MRLTLSQLVTPNPAGLSLEGCRLASEYSAAHKGVTLLVMVNGQIVFEDYPHGGPERAHDIASGTKSFVGVLALAAAADGLLHLDEQVADTIPEWRAEPRKDHITLRQLLQLTSGLESGGKHGRVPTYADALLVKVIHPPGERFLYASAPFQVFGEVLRRKLASRHADPLEYLEARIFAPLGLRAGHWRRGADDLPHLSSGATLNAREWAKFGELIRRDGRWHDHAVLPARLLHECFHGSADNPSYGLTWWLNAPVPDTPRSRQRHATFGLDDLTTEPAIPRDLVFAAGAGKQRLYVSREKHLVVVRQATGILEALANGERGGFSDREFLHRLLAAESPTPAA
jgi:CubicO group peptidase (beta-lactamase class C family)